VNVPCGKTLKSHTERPQSACAGCVETVVCSKLETISSMAEGIRSDGTCDVLRKNTECTSHGVRARCVHTEYRVRLRTKVEVENPTVARW
jgi:hypothetical protein